MTEDFDRGDKKIHVSKGGTPPRTLCGKTGQSWVSSASGYWGPGGGGWPDVCRACSEREHKRNLTSAVADVAYIRNGIQRALADAEDIAVLEAARLLHAGKRFRFVFTSHVDLLHYVVRVEEVA